MRSAVTDFWENHKVSSNARNAAAKGVLAGTDVECGFNYVVNQAKKEGKTPDPTYLELVKSEKQISFAVSQ